MNYTDEYISKKALEDKIKANCYIPTNGTVVLTDVTAILRWVKEIPAANVTPVRHGEWLNPRHTPYVTCSLCGGTVATLWKGFFCQNCGAKMDGGEGNGA